MKKLQIILPVRNEEKSIALIVSEIDAVILKKNPGSFIICEDGSQDHTLSKIKSLAKKYPIILVSGSEVKGYSRAVIDGYKKSTAKYILTMDSDGQCDPVDFPRLWKWRNKYDIVIGKRTNRQDPWQRKLFSSFFNKIYKILFPVNVSDPSCPYVLINSKALNKIINKLGTLREGFWWEFIARAYQSGLTIKEVPVNHRNRLDGKSRVYTLKNIPRIGISHFLGVLKIRFS